jgi:hypothetical protein
MARCATYAASKGGTARPIALSTLGSALGILYERTGNPRALQEAITVCTSALEDTGIGDSDWRVRTNSLASLHQSEYYRTGKSTHLEKALDYGKQMFEVTNDTDPCRSSTYSNYAGLLTTLYQKTGEQDILNKAIDIIENALRIRDREATGEAGMMFNLGSLLHGRFDKTGNSNDIERAAKIFYEVWGLKSSPIYVRVQAGAACLKIWSLQRRFQAAVELGKNMIDLLPAVSKSYLEQKDQQFVVKTFAGATADLCACMLELGQIQDALQYMERGRAVIIHQLMDYRSEQYMLRKVYPNVYARYESLRRKLNKSMTGMPSDFVSRVGVLQAQGQTAEEFRAYIDEIRKLPGQERFLLELALPEIQACAKGGTVVIVNVTNIRSDAILVSSETIDSISLPLLEYQKVEEWLSTKWHVRKSRAKMNMKYLESLAWLWDACVEKILNRIHQKPIKGNLGPFKAKRIWWIGCGLASSLPFHAAGNHSSGSKENAFERTVSSYIASIKALSHSINSVARTKRMTGPILIATMPTTPDEPGRKSLPNLPVESESLLVIEEAKKYKLPIEHLNLKSVEDVIGNLQNCQIAHFDCHGLTNAFDPSGSCLVLQTGEGSNAKRDLLKVGRVSELDLPKAWLVYLSACSTAENKSKELSEEVFHVVSSFQVAGFPHAIGCLWPAPDDVSGNIAVGFYRILLKKSTDSDELDVVSIFREVVMAARDEDREMPLTWAQFVHYGP